MSLADVLAVSQAADSIVLLGDPQQLDQPTQGSHPDGTEASALSHLLGEHQTIPPDCGLFLAETWRLHPSICDFTSEVFYEQRLASHDGLALQRVDGHPWLGPAGLWYVPVSHEGNTNSAREEVERIAQIVDSLLAPGVTWTNHRGETRPLTAADIPRRRPLQRAGRGPRGASGRARWDRGQIPRTRGGRRDLFPDDVQPAGCAARDGVSLQPQPAQRGNIARTSHRGHRRQATTL